MIISAILLECLWFEFYERFEETQPVCFEIVYNRMYLDL